jgi:hypothetical protein
MEGVVDITTLRATSGVGGEATPGLLVAFSLGGVEGRSISGIVESIGRASSGYNKCVSWRHFSRWFR